MPSSEAMTKGVRIEVTSRYVAERSAPEDGEWFFAYTVRITNEGSESVQLISRHWIITDAEGRQQEVKGPGVVGEQPTLRPGESFEYTSACPLSTSIGAMQGSYQMVTSGGDRFDATIAPFTLSEPYAMN
jgi:ApaG protein